MGCEHDDGASVALAANHLSHQPSREWIKRVHGFVEDHHVGLAQQGGGNGHLLSVSGRQVGHGLPLRRIEADPFEGSIRFIRAVETAELKRLAGRLPIRDTQISCLYAASDRADRVRLPAAVHRHHA